MTDLRPEATPGDAARDESRAATGWRERDELRRDHHREVLMLAKCLLALFVVACVIVVRECFLA